MEVVSEVFYLPELLHHIGQQTQVRAEQKGLLFETHLSPNLPEWVVGDKRKLRQVLLNLLGNAVKFTPAGRITFRADWHPGTDSNQGIPLPILRFLIEDTGVGIASDQLARIFQPFQQIRESSDFEGTGLGLSITDQLVRLMNGDLYVASQAGRGTQFRLSLGLPAADSPAIGRTMLNPVARLGQSIAGYEGPRQTILVADDGWENCSILTNLLQPLGFTVVEARNGREAVGQALAHNPDLILLDLVMPYLDGYGALKKIRASSATNAARIFAFSAKVFEQDKQRSQRAGFDDFIPKPIDLDALLIKIGTHLNLTWQTRPPTGELAAPTVSNRTQAIPTHLPEPAQLRSLYELARLGDIQGILTQLDGVERASPDYEFFVADIRRAVSEFDTRRIKKYLQACLQTL